MREFFGRSNFGAIFGLAIGMSFVGSLAGPPLAGWVFDEFGTYTPVWLAFAGVMFVALLLMATMRRYRGNDTASHPLSNE